MYGDGCDFYALWAGVVEELLKACGLVDYDVEAVRMIRPSIPTQARIMKESREVAFPGEIHPASAGESAASA